MARKLFIHGFLGTPSFPSVSITDSQWWDTTTTLPEWGERFASSAEEGSTLIGYSLGGRLALHAWAADPTKWEQVILLSTHPGLQTEEERKERLASDRAWIEILTAKPWNEAWQQWNSQPIFGPNADPAPPFPGNDVITHHLTYFSLGMQEDFREKIARSSTSFTWVAGENDAKFVTLAQEIAALNRQSNAIILPKQFHRISAREWLQRNS